MKYAVLTLVALSALTLMGCYETISEYKQRENMEQRLKNLEQRDCVDPRSNPPRA